MKKKLLLVVMILLFAGCGAKNDPYDLTYSVVSRTVKQIDENNARIYAVLENTSKNSGKIAYIEYGSDKNENEKIYSAKDINERVFNAGEQILVIIDAPVSVDKISKNMYLRPYYDNDKPIIANDQRKKYEDVDIVVPKIKAKDNGNVTIDVQYIKNVKGGKIKVTAYDTDFNKICMAYIKTDKNLETDKNYTYKFKCDTKIGEDSTIIFEKEKEEK